MRSRTRLGWLPRLMVVGMVASAVASPASASLSATRHTFSATYTGSGHGQVQGTSVSGRATLHGRGRPMGRSTLSGSARGIFINSVCVVWSGRGVLRSKAGSITLTAHGARACARADGNTVSFAGSAKVARGTSTFKGAHGTLSFHGAYGRNSGAVSISFKGQISY